MAVPGLARDVQIVEVSDCADLRLVVRLAARCGPATLSARFLRPVRGPVDHRLVALLLDLSAGPGTGSAPRAAFLALAEGRPVGLVNVVSNARGETEIGLLVADRWQRRGIGRALAERVLTDPRWAGRTLLATVSPDNDAVLGLLRSLPGWRPHLAEADPDEWFFELRPEVGVRSDDRPVSPRMAG